MYVLFSLVTMAMSHFTALEIVVKSDLLVTVNVFITHVLGTIVGSNFPPAHSTGISPSSVPTSYAAAVQRVGLLSRLL